MKIIVLALVCSTIIPTNASLLGGVGKLFTKKAAKVNGKQAVKDNGARNIVKQFSDEDSKEVFIKICDGMLHKGSWVNLESISERSGLSISEIKTYALKNQDLLASSINASDVYILKLKGSGFKTFRNINSDPEVRDQMIEIFNAFHNKQGWANASSISERLDLPNSFNIKSFTVRNPDLLERKINSSGNTIVRMTEEGRMFAQMAMWKEINK